MTEEQWSASDVPSWMVVWAGKSSGRKLQLLACAACRTVWKFLIDERSRIALQKLEEYADNFDNMKLHQVAGKMSDEAWRALWTARQGGKAAYAVCRAAQAARNLDLCDDVLSVLTEEGGIEPPVARQLLCSLVRDVFGNPFRSVSIAPTWRTSDVLALARAMYDSRDFFAMQILADALQEAGCDGADILDHCRGGGPHVRGCWVVDLVLGKE